MSPTQKWSKRGYFSKISRPERSPQDMDIIVGVSDMKISNDPQSIIVTYSLGSCIGITIYDPVVKVGGLLHFQLPDSGINTQDAQRDPCKYADMAIPVFFKTAYRLGARKQRMKVVMTGGANLMDENSHFDIGKRNYLAARKLFYRNNVLTSYEDVGGSNYRTVRLDLDSGCTLISGPRRSGPMQI